MQKYKDYSLISFDNNTDIDKKDWLVLLGQNRDSDLLEISNFTTALIRLGDESDYVKRHKFEHWLCGWIEIIIINPENKDILKIGQDIEKSLKSYPILDDDHFSALQYEEKRENRWSQCGRTTMKTLKLRE